MKTKIFSTLILFLIALGTNVLKAQSGSNAAGIEATGSDGSVNASVGQVFTSTYTSSSAYIAEGVQQPYEISVITSVEPVANAAERIDVYPNPFTDAVNIRLENRSTGNWAYTLFNMNGQKVIQGQLNGDVTLIPAAFLVKGSYLLSVVEGNMLVKSFKIIKN